MKSTFSFRFDRGKPARETLVVYCPPGTPETAALRETAAAAGTGGLPDEILVLAPAPLAQRIADVKPTDPAMRRVANLHQEILMAVGHLGPAGEIVELLPLGDRAPAAKMKAEAIFTAGVTHLFHTRGGEVKSSEGFHFLNPSGKHSRSFLRLSNLLVRHAEIAFVAAAALRHVPADRTALLVDTPALFAVGEALNRLRREFDLAELALENFASYAKSTADETPDKTTFLISASTSGSLARSLKGDGVKAVYRDDQFVHVLYLARDPSKFPVVCDLTRARNSLGVDPDREVFRDTNCDLCASGSFAVRLQGDHFEIGKQWLDAVEMERTTALAVTVEPIARDLIGAKALRVQTDRTASSAFQVDVSALLGASSFRKRLEYAVARAFPASTRAIVHLDDPGSEELARHLSPNAPNAPVMAQHSLETDGLAAGSGALVVVAGALGSGRALRAIGLTLRRLAPGVPLVYFVGFSKMPTAARTRMEKTLCYTPEVLRHALVIVSSVPLPDRSFPNPWRAELELLSEPEFRRLEEPAAAAFETRRTLLSSSTPQFEDLFWAAANGAPLAFTDGFVFWNEHRYDIALVSQGDLYFAVASLLGSLRAAETGKSLRSSAFRHPVLSAENFARYSDPILQACLLRAAEPSELNYLDEPYQSLEMSRSLSRIVAAPTSLRGGPAIEVLIAVATDRLKLRPEHALELIDCAKNSSGATPEMTVLCDYARSRIGV